MRRCSFSCSAFSEVRSRAEQTVEDAARIVLRRNRPAVQVVGDGARAREIAGAGIDRKHQRRLPAVLLGVQRDHLIEAGRVVGAGLRILQRSARQPHVGADVRVGLGTVGVVQAAHEAELACGTGSSGSVDLPKTNSPFALRGRETSSTR